MNEYERRMEAIRRVKQGEKVSHVCAALGRSRSWYYKWAVRFRKHGRDGFVDRRNQNQGPYKTAEWVRALIVETRDRLVKQAETGESFVGIDAKEVWRQLAGVADELPHWRTVHRILVEAGRVPANRERKPVNYCPRPSAEVVNDVHQIDIWPRLLLGGERISFFHLVDVASWYPFGLVCGDKCSETVRAFLLAAWRELGLPLIAQFDNEMSFTGGRWAHRLGQTVRLCLALGVQVWFIPTYTPKRNGFVENFHSQCNRFFWSRHRFQTLAEVQATYPNFLCSFRQEHVLPAIAGQTPAQARGKPQNEAHHRPLPVDFCLSPQLRLPIVSGLVHCVRLADRHGRVNILNRRHTLGNAYARHYVLAKIRPEEQQMTLYQQPDADTPLQCIDAFPFPLSEPVVPFDPTFSYLFAEG